MHQLVRQLVSPLVNIFELQYLGNYWSYWAETWNLVLFWPKLWIVIKKNLKIPTFLLHKLKSPTLPYEVKLKNGSADFKNILHTYYLG